MTTRPPPAQRMILRLSVIFLTAALAAAALLPATPSRASLPGPAEDLPWLADQPPAGGSALVAAGSSIYVGGDFDAFGRPSSLGLLDRAGGLPIVGMPRLDGSVAAITDDGADGWFVAGAFSVTGQPMFSNLIHVKADKTLDRDWNPGIGEPIDVLARNSSALFIYSNSARRPFFQMISISTAQITVLDSDVPDTFFGETRAIVADDTTVFVAGPSLYAIDIARRALLWGRSTQRITALALKGNTLYLAGNIFSLGGEPLPGGALAAFDIRTQQILPFKVTLDPPFFDDDHFFSPTITSLALLDDTIYIEGDFSTVNSQPRKRVAAVDAVSGALRSWQPALEAVTSDTKLRILGTADHTVAMHVARPGSRETVTALDSTSGVPIWQQQLPGATRALAAGSTTLAVGGVQNMVDQGSTGGLVAFERSADQPSAWYPRPDGTVTRLAASDTTLYVAGGFSQIAGQPRAGLAAFDRASGALSSWNPQPDGPITALLLGGERLYVAGRFSQIAGETRNNGLAAFDLASGALLPWQPAPLVGGSVRALALDAGRLYIGVQRVSQQLLLMALDTQSGAALWSSTFQGQQITDLAVSAGRLYASGKFALGLNSYAVAVLDSTIDDAPPAGLFKDTTAADLQIHDNILYLASFRGLLGIDLTSGSELAWVFGASTCVGALADDGAGMLALECSGALRRHPYSQTPRVAQITLRYTDSGLTLVGRVNPNNSQTNVTFQVTTMPGVCDALTNLPVSGTFSGSADQEVSATLSQPANGALYYYRMVATNAFGSSASDVRSITVQLPPTPTAPPSPSATPAAPTATPTDPTAPAQVFLPLVRRCGTDGF